MVYTIRLLIFATIVWLMWLQLQAKDEKQSQRES